IPYIFFALVNLTSIHGVSLNGMNLFYNIKMLMGLPLPRSVVHHHPLISAQAKHIMQGLGILAGSILSIVFCLRELQKALNSRQRNKIIALFSVFLAVITGYSLYVFMFL
ncbi:MAG: hypothetical protein WCI71_09085, partial [Bacteroidota bacterium]